MNAAAGAVAATKAAVDALKRKNTDGNTIKEDEDENDNNDD